MEISYAELKILADEKGFNIQLMEKDYLITNLLFLLKDIKGIYFKGGTAINKIFLHHARLSEDLDFTVTEKIPEVENEIREALKGTRFAEITHDKRVEGFVRLIVHYNVFHGPATVFIDLNKRAELLCPPEKHQVEHFYKDYFPAFSVNTLSEEEMIAEKMAATIGRNKPRDHFDLYMLLKKGYGVNLKIVKEKCRQAGDEFSITRMFNQAKKLKKRWDEDMAGLLAEPVSFQELMRTLAKHFRLKEEKDKRKAKI